MSWVHAVIFAHWKEQIYRVSAGMFPRQGLQTEWMTTTQRYEGAAVGDSAFYDQHQTTATAN